MEITAKESKLAKNFKRNRIQWSNRWHQIKTPDQESVQKKPQEVMLSNWWHHIYLCSMSFRHILVVSLRTPHMWSGSPIFLSRSYIISFAGLCRLAKSVPIHNSAAEILLKVSVGRLCFPVLCLLWRKGKAFFTSEWLTLFVFPKWINNND